MNTMLALCELGINPFGAVLVAESYRKLAPEIKDKIPSPLVFVIKGVRFTIEDAPAILDAAGNVEQQAKVATREPFELSGQQFYE